MSWVRRLFARERMEIELDKELRFHFEAQVADKVRAGVPESEARRLTRLEFGGIDQIKEDCRESRGTMWLESMLQDVRYGLRQLRKSPGFAIIAIGSLALGIGANTAIFTITSEVLLDKLPVYKPEDLRLFAWSGGKNRVPIRIWGHWNEVTHACTSFSYPVYQLLRRQSAFFEDVFAFKDIPQVTVSVADKPEPVKAELVSGNYYSALGVNAALGRAIQDSDDGAPASAAVAVISDGLWARHFGRSRDVIGKSIQVNLAPVTIIGVNPRGFTGASSVGRSPDIFLPFSMEPLAAPGGESLLATPNEWWVLVMGRIRPGVSDESARAAMDLVLSNAVRSTMTVEKGQSVPRFAMQGGSRGEDLDGEQYSRPVYVLMALAGLVLLLACANLANLLLARAGSRQRELSVRVAVGARRGRILRQMLVESLLLSTAGGAAGLLLGYCSRNAIPHLMSSSWQTAVNHVRFDWKVFGFTAAISLVTGLLFGFMPAWRAMHAPVNSGLKENAHSATQGSANLSGRILVAVQITLSMLLLVGAGLFIRTLTNLNRSRLGFQPDNIVLFEIQAPATRYPAPKDLALFREIEDRLASAPGIRSVSLSKNPLIAGNVSNDDFVPDGLPPKLNGPAYVDDNVVGQNFFATMGIPILAGRSFDSTDTETSTLVAVVNQRLVKEYFLNVNPVGRTFISNKKRIEIIGVSGDTRYASLRYDPPATFYTPYRQQSKSQPSVTFEVSSPIEQSALVPILRRAVAAVDKDLPLLDIRTQNAQISDRTRQERIFASLTSGFGLLALMLASIGIYGIMAYSVSRRTNEIGIRMALGAERKQVLCMVLGESAWMAMIGVAAGTGSAMALVRLISSMLYGLKTYDPLTFAASAVLLLVVGLTASWIPARRAATLDPMRALRHE
ncbi:MAG TPA: ABC transporter permease [Acidobacteriaceae bacterium]|nr:ABC transporter permease [Acidobacteriaceae bacterium]